MPSYNRLLEQAKCSDTLGQMLRGGWKDNAASKNTGGCARGPGPVPSTHAAPGLSVTAAQASGPFFRPLQARRRHSTHPCSKTTAYIKEKRNRVVNREMAWCAWARKDYKLTKSTKCLPATRILLIVVGALASCQRPTSGRQFSPPTMWNSGH